MSPSRDLHSTTMLALTTGTAQSPNKAGSLLDLAKATTRGAGSMGRKGQEALQLDRTMG